MALSVMRPVLRRVSPALSLKLVPPRRLPTGTVGLGLSSQARHFSISDEIWTAKQIFCSVKKLFERQEDIDRIGMVKVAFEKPEHLGTSFWEPSRHDSLESYVKTLPGIEGYNVAKMRAEYDWERAPMQVVNGSTLKHFLSIPEKDRPVLRISVEPLSHLTKAFTKVKDFGMTVKENSEKVRMWCKERFLQSQVSQTEVDKSVEALQDAKVDIKADSLEGTGDIKEFKGIDMEKFPALAKSLQDDEIPKKIINAINRALLMETSSEAVFAWKLAGGKLEYVYLVQILALKYTTEMGEKVDMLMAHYEIKVEGASEVAEGVTGSERNWPRRPRVP